MTDEERELEIRWVWGEYVLRRGIPRVHGSILNIPVRRQLPNFLGNDVGDPIPAIVAYRFIFEEREVHEGRYGPLKSHRGTEITVKCEGVIVYRNWRPA